MGEQQRQLCCLCPPGTLAFDPDTGRIHRHTVTANNFEAVCNIQPTSHHRVAVGASFCCLHLAPGHKQRVHVITHDLVAIQDAAPRAASKQYGSSLANGLLAPKTPPAQRKRKRVDEDADVPVVSPKRPGAAMSATRVRAELASLRVNGMTPAIVAFLESRA